MKRVARAVLGLLIVAAVLPLLDVGVAHALVGPPVLVAPFDGNLAVQSNPTFEWNPVAGATSYQLQVSQGANIEVNIQTVNTRYTPTFELQQKAYTWRVASYDANNALGSYSAPFSFTKVPSVAPTGLAPADGKNCPATLAFPGLPQDPVTNPLIAPGPAACPFWYPNHPPTFSWSPYVGASYYHIQIASTENFQSPIVDADVFTTAFTQQDLPPVNQTFYWHVAARTQAGQSSQYSETRQFQVAWASHQELNPTWPGSGPQYNLFSAEPTLLEPKNTIPLTVVDEVNFRWTAVAGAATYDLQYSTAIDFNTNPVLVTAIRYLGYSPPVALQNTSYFWRVRARNGLNGTGAWSAVSTFTRAWPPSSISQIPAIPVQPNDSITLLTPTNGDFNVTTPTFSWTPQRLASRYEIQFANNAAFNSGVFSCFTTHTIYTPSSACAPGLSVGSQYFWHVRALDDPAAITGIFSPTFSFIHRDPMVVPSVAGTTERPLLQWPKVTNIGKYRVTIFDKNDAVSAIVDTQNTRLVPQNLQASLSPYKFYVQTMDWAGVLGLIPGSTTSFSYTGPAPVAGAFVVSSTAADVTAPALSWPSRAPSIPLPAGQQVTYNVEYAVPQSGIWLPLVQTLTTNGYAHLTDSIGPGTWDVRVLAVQNSTVIATSATGQFTITPLLLSTLVQPTNGSGTPVVDTPTFTWNPIPGAVSYKIEFAQDANFTTPLHQFDAQTRYSTFTPPASFPDVQAGKATYWYVVPCLQNSCGPGAASFQGTPDQNKIFSFRKQSAQVKILAPLNDVATPPANPNDVITFKWEDYLKTNLNPPVGSPAATQEALAYHIVVSTRPDFATILDDKTVDGTEYVPWDRDYPDGPIYWKVQAVDGSGNLLTPSPPTFMTTNKKSPVPTSLTPGIICSPVPGVACPNTSYPVAISAPTLSWAPLPHNIPLPVNTPANSPLRETSASFYQVQIYKNPELPITPANLVFLDNTYQAAITPRSILPSGDYGWRVRRYDVDGLPGPWSADDNVHLTRFKIVGATANPTAPINNASELDGSRLWFKWTGVANAAYYRIDISTAAAAFSPNIESVNTPSLAYNPTVKYSDGVYKWRVIPFDASNQPISPVASAPIFTFQTGQAGSRFHPLAPTRILDSRLNVGFNGKVQAGSPRTLKVTGGNVPSTARAVILNVTATGSTVGSFLTVFPSGDLLPTASNLNFGAGETIANLVTAKVGTGGSISIATAAGATDVIADIVGYYDDGVGTGDRYIPKSPQRFLDSRTPIGNWGAPLGDGASRALTIKGVNGIPSTATSVVMNVTATAGTKASFLTVYPTPSSGNARPNASNVNFGGGQTIPNLVVVQLGAGGQVSFFNAAGSVDVIADVVGYYDSTAGDLFHSLSPSRILDSRLNNGLGGPWGPANGGPAKQSLQVTGRGGVPSYASAVVMNTTVTAGTAGSFLTVFPTGAALPNASNLNFGAGQTIPNLVMVKTGDNGQVDINNAAGNVQVIADAVGYFASF